MAVQRDQGPPRKPVKNKTPAGQADTKGVQQGYADVLISAIPTEVLAPYTFVVGVIVGTISAGEDERLFMRWMIYGAGLLLIVVWLYFAYRHERGTKQRRFPLAETLAALTAFAAWGLVMPGSPLSAELEGDDLTIWNVLITVTAAIIVGLILGKPLKKPSSKAK